MELPKNTSEAGMQGKQITPEVTWAQRSSSSEPEKNHIFLTIAVPDVSKQNIKLDVQPTHLDFTGYSETKKATYHVHLDFYAEIDPSKNRINHTPRDVEMVLQKKELDAAYWPRLLKDKAKVHFLKTDFDKWVDEDEQDERAEDDDYMSRMGGMGGMGADGGFGGIDFSKLGGGDMGDMGGDEDAEDDDDDDEMPGLEVADAKKDGEEAAEGAAAEGKGKAKIEEVA